MFVAGCSFRPCVQLCLGARDQFAYAVAGIDCGMLAAVTVWTARDMWHCVSSLKHSNYALVGVGIYAHGRRVAGSLCHRARWRRSRLHLRASSGQRNVDSSCIRVRVCRRRGHQVKSGRLLFDLHPMASGHSSACGQAGGADVGCCDSARLPGTLHLSGAFTRLLPGRVHAAWCGPSSDGGAFCNAECSSPIGCAVSAVST